MNQAFRRKATSRSGPQEKIQTGRVRAIKKAQRF